MFQKLFNPEWQITSKSFLLSSSLIGFSFSPTMEISRLEFEFEESLPRRVLDRSRYLGTRLTFSFKVSQVSKTKQSG